MSKSRAAVWAILAAALISLAPAAEAHNGVGAAYKGRAGHYIVYAYDGYLDSPDRVEYRIVLLNGRTRQPVYGVHPSVTATPERPGGRRSVTAGDVTVYGNVVYYVLPNPYPSDWRVRLTLRGPLGHGSTRFRMHGVAPVEPAADAGPIYTERSTFPTVPVLAGGIGAALLLGAVGWGWRRRGRTRR